MRKFKNTMLGLVMGGLLISSIPVQAFANTPQQANSPEELFGMAGKNYNTEAQPLSRQLASLKFIDNLIVSNDQVVLINNGESEFIDVIGDLGNGKYINLTNEVNWFSDNTDVAVADLGRILAIGQGEANITIAYGDLQKVIPVSVSGTLDIASEIERINTSQPGISMFAFSDTDRDNVITIAKGMVEVTWTPTKNVRGWRNNTTFKANTKYTGMPYSQTEYQKDKDGLTNALKNSDFYDDYTRFDIIMPKYGSDCSGFVSFAWGLSRKTTADFVAGVKDGTYTKVGTYDAESPTASSLKTAYKSLKKGDAVVKSGHTFIIASNDTTNSKVYVYEQTPNQALYTSWTYATMSTDGYMPFTKK